MTISYRVDELNEHHLQDGFLETLSFLSEVGSIPLETILETYHKLRRNPDNHIFIAVSQEGRVIGSITLLIEQKFIHGCGRVGHIEDVVVHEDFRHKNIANSLMEQAIQVAKETGCYKIILNCTEDLAPFYEKFGFRRHEIEMRLDVLDQWKEGEIP